MHKEYYYLDINLIEMRVVDWGTTFSPTLTGNTEDTNTHRVFLTKGQFNKMKKLL